MQQIRDQKLADLISDAAALLEPLFSQPGDRTYAMQDFKEQLIDAAFKLNQQIRISPVKYAFDGSYVSGAETRPAPLGQGYTESSILITQSTATTSDASTDSCSMTMEASVKRYVWSSRVFHG